MFIAIGSGLLGQFGGPGATQVLASSKLSSGPISLPLVEPLAPVYASSDYLHIFDGIFLQGCDLYIPAGTSLPNLGNLSRCGAGSWDNAISSFTLGSGAWVRFYRDINYGGPSVQYTGPGYADLMDPGWDDVVSSLQVGFVAAPAP